MTPSTPIETIEQLKEYLYIAMQLEHATIPPYLTAAYTAKLKGSYGKKIEGNAAARETILAVAREEMLHLTLAANLLNAIGGEPNFLREGFVVKYPCHLPDGETDFEVSIASFSPCIIKTFLDIERPTPPKEFRKAAAVVMDDCKIHRIDLPSDAAVPQEMASLMSQDGKIKYIEHQDLQPETRGRGRGLLPPVMVQSAEGATLELHYWSIGEFYNAIRNGFEHLADKPEPLFVGETSRQVPFDAFFDGGGKLTEITDLATAIAAIDLISTQGEGYTDETCDMSKELAHYYRFEQIDLRRYYVAGDKPHHPSGRDFPVNFDEVHPIKQDAKLTDYIAFPTIEGKARLFNERYRAFLEMLNEAFNGKPQLIKESYAVMFQIAYDIERLVSNELGNTGAYAAPTFEVSGAAQPSEGK